jgi:NOL1/NOP2/sun family putative RNA methylase
MSENNGLALFKSLLINDYGEDITQQIFENIKGNRVVSFRVNSLKTTKDDVKRMLNHHHIHVQDVPWYEDAMILIEGDERVLEQLEIYHKGDIYLQSLSSMIPPLVLNPKPKTDILDMAAAPGGKTTQIASLTHNQAFITACEAQPIRAEKLKYNLEKQGTKNVQLIINDARKLDDFFRFDQILLDAPCSGSGTILIEDEKTYHYFSDKLIQKSHETQVALLDKALRLLKSGQTMIYSTCSILRKENEDVIQQMMKKHAIELLPIEGLKGDDMITLPSTLHHVMLIAPSSHYEGFFIAKIKKK